MPCFHRLITSGYHQALVWAAGAFSTDCCHMAKKETFTNIDHIYFFNFVSIFTIYRDEEIYSHLMAYMSANVHRNA